MDMNQNVQKNKNVNALNGAGLSEKISEPKKDATENYDANFGKKVDTEQSNDAKVCISGGESRPPRKKSRWRLWVPIFSALILASFVANKIAPAPENETLVQSGKPISTSIGAQEMLSQRWSDKLELGARLVSNDDQVTLKPADMTFTHNKSEETTKIWVWDFAAEDGDYVHVLVDGKPISEPFMIKHEPVSFDVGKNSVVNVIGVRDGGGGITYAIHIDAIGQTYLNGTDINQANTYTMHYEPNPN